MRQVDQPESFQPIGAPIRPEPTKPPAPRPEGASGIVTDSQGRVQTTSHPKPPMRNYSDILDAQGMVHRDSFPPNSLKWVGEAADKWREKLTFAPPDDPNPFYSSEGLTWEAKPIGDWRGIHAIQAADMASIMDQFNSMAEQMNAEWDRDMGRKADRD